MSVLCCGIILQQMQLYKTWGIKHKGWNWLTWNKHLYSPGVRNISPLGCMWIYCALQNKLSAGWSPIYQMALSLKPHFSPFSYLTSIVIEEIAHVLSKWCQPNMLQTGSAVGDDTCDNEQFLESLLVHQIYVTGKEYIPRAYIASVLIARRIVIVCVALHAATQLRDEVWRLPTLLLSLWGIAHLLM